MDLLTITYLGFFGIFAFSIYLNCIEEVDPYDYRPLKPNPAEDDLEAQRYPDVWHENPIA